VVAIAIGVVLLPELSRRLQSGDTAGGQDAYSRAGEVALALTLPCAIALLVVPLPMISVLFERGQFTSDDAAATALAVAVYGLGLPAFVLQKIFQPLYFAREDTKSPFKFALVSMVVNAVIAVGLWPYLDYLAAALATTLAGWTMAWQLWRGSRKFGQAGTFDARLRARLLLHRQSHRRVQRCGFESLAAALVASELGHHPHPTARADHKGQKEPSHKPGHIRDPVITRPKKDAEHQLDREQEPDQGKSPHRVGPNTRKLDPQQEGKRPDQAIGARIRSKERRVYGDQSSRNRRHEKDSQNGPRRECLTHGFSKAQHDCDHEGGMGEGAMHKRIGYKPHHLLSRELPGLAHEFP